MLKVPFITFDTALLGSYAEAAVLFSQLPWENAAQSNWEDQYRYKPIMSFQLLHTKDSLLIHFDVSEDFIRAEAVRHNEAVWKDSCVECFLSFDQGATYYNMEFNVLGTGLIGYGGTERKARKRMSEDQVNSVATFTQVSRVGQQINWQMIWVLPLTLFGLTEGTLSGKMASANFYKCGDGLPDPHYLSWQAIGSPTPNFHLPEYFGQLLFL